MYVEKTGLGPFETARVEARPDGRFRVDTGASSMGPGLETALAQILGSALGLPADRFDVRHPDTAAIESGVGTYGSRGTVTAGNAAQMAADKLVEDARGARRRAVRRPRGRGRLRRGHLRRARAPGRPGRAGRRGPAGRRRVVQRAQAHLCAAAGWRWWWRWTRPPARCGCAGWWWAPTWAVR